MPSSKGYLDFILEQLSELEDVSHFLAWYIQKKSLLIPIGRIITEKYGMDKALVEQIARLYLPHPGVTADWIMGKRGDMNHEDSLPQRQPQQDAAQKLAGMGYTNMYELGGIITWTGDIVTTEEEQKTAMTIKIGEQAFPVTLEDSGTARAFAALLPMELHMTELNGNEKYHYLMSGLPIAPQRVGHIEAGEIMLFGDDCVVLFYRSFDTPYSYTRIGRISNIDGLADTLGDSDVDVRFDQRGLTDGDF